MTLQLGQIVEATRATAVCSIGERGVVYEIHYLGGSRAASVIFETGRYDGFSPEEQDMMLRTVSWTPPDLERLGQSLLFDGNARSYQFVNVMKLGEDYRRGRFNFHPEDR